jgi:polysaccharide export outer membrane protein
MNRYRSVVYVFFLGFLLIGCASTSVDKKGEETDGGTPEDKSQAVQEVGNIGISEFVLGVGDTIDISVYRNDDLKKTFKIDPSGVMIFPLIGDVRVAGKSVTGLRDEMKEKLSRYLVDPQISISVSSVQSQKIIVLGEVKSPGIFSLDSNLSVLDSIAKAGGLTDNAKTQNIVLMRKATRQPEIVSLELGKESGGEILLATGDVVYVPKVAIANASWFFGHISKILSPFLSIESGIALWPQVESAFGGEDVLLGQTITVPTTAQ